MTDTILQSEIMSENFAAFEDVDVTKEVSETREERKKERPKIESLQDLIDALHDIFKENTVNIEEVEEAMKQYKSNPNDWKKFITFDLFRYTRNLVDEGNGKFNLMVLCWGENQASNIHDHSNSDCFVKVLDGQLTEVLFDWPKNEGKVAEEANPNSMQAISSTVHSKNEVTYMNDSKGLHQMLNPSHTNKSVTLHLYSPPFNSCKVFDQQNGKSIEVKMVFWSKYGKLDKEMKSCK